MAPLYGGLIVGLVEPSLGPHARPALESVHNLLVRIPPPTGPTPGPLPVRSRAPSQPLRLARVVVGVWA